jgi:hypothetical protein
MVFIRKLVLKACPNLGEWKYYGEDALVNISKKRSKERIRIIAHGLTVVKQSKTELLFRVFAGKNSESATCRKIMKQSRRKGIDRACMIRPS